MAEEHEPVLVMDVSGSGKCTVARGLTERLGGVFVDADNLHPEETVAAMSRGEPLTDEVRWGWLDRVAEKVAKTKPFAVFTCSAFKRAYRDMLHAHLGDFRTVHLEGDYDLLRDRMAQRKGHYMPVSLLDSQFEALVRPTEDEHTVAVSVAPPPEKIVGNALAKLSSCPE